MRIKIVTVTIGVALLILGPATILRIRQEGVDSVLMAQARRPEKPIAPRLRMIPSPQDGIREKREEQQRLLGSVRVSLEDLPEPPVLSNETPEELDARLRDMDKRLEQIMPTAEELDGIVRANKIEEEIQEALSNP